MKRVWNVLVAVLIVGLIVATIVGALLGTAMLTAVVGPEPVIVGGLVVLIICLALLFTDFGKRDFRGRQ